MRDLACAAAACRAFQAAYLDRAAEERASLTELVTDVEKPVFSAFTTRLQQAMSGSPSVPNLNYRDDRSVFPTRPIHGVLVTDVSEPKYAAREPELATWLSLTEPRAIFCPTSGEHAFFSAYIYLQPLGGDDARLACSYWSMFKSDEANMDLEIVMGIPQAAYVLAFILAACRESPEASPPSCEFPLMVHLLITGGSKGRAGLREAEDLVAPLRPLSESVTIRRQYHRISPRGYGVKAGVVVKILKLRV